MAENACAQLRETSKIPVPGTFTVRWAKVPGESEVSGGMGLLWGSPSADISTAFSSSFTLRDSRKCLPGRHQPLNDRRRLQKTRRGRGHHSKGCAVHKSRACVQPSPWKLLGDKSSAGVDGCASGRFVPARGETAWGACICILRRSAQQ